jgi:hypothetical protein
MQGMASGGNFTWKRLQTSNARASEARLMKSVIDSLINGDAICARRRLPLRTDVFFNGAFPLLRVTGFLLTLEICLESNRQCKQI